MATDRELIEAAAKAAGLRVHALRQAERDAAGAGDAGLWIVDGSTCWNPLTDDGTAFRLAVALRIDIAFEVSTNIVWTDGNWWSEPERADRDAATRRAITRAAAHIGGLTDA